MPKEPVVPVVFRRFKNGEVIALFPTMPSSCVNRYEINSYMHVGQHGGASTDLVHTTRAAKPSEFKSLAQELRSIGYRLKVVKKITGKHRNELARNWAKDCEG